MMKEVTFRDIDAVSRSELLGILNSSDTRHHLIAHEPFTQVSLDDWIAGKVVVNAAEGCRIRGIEINQSVAGWCGIQYEDGAFEMAIVLARPYWGIGKFVFHTIMAWAAELQHNEIVLHLLHTRSEYRFLTQMALRVHHSTMFGTSYTSYVLPVPLTQ